MSGFTGLNEKTLSRLYVEMERTDKEIAEFYGVDRTAIVKLRQRYNVPARETVGGIGEDKALTRLRDLGFKVIDMNKSDMTSPFDLLVNSRIRVDVKTSSLIDNSRFLFSLSDRPEKECIESEYRIRLKNGRTRKLFHKTCDFLLLVGIADDQDYMFIVPSDVVPDKLQSLSIPKSFRSNKYSKYFENWELLRAKGAATPLGSL